MWSRGVRGYEGVDGWHCLLLCLWGRASAKLLRGSTSWHRWLPRCCCQRPQALDSVSVCLILLVRRETAVGSTADVRVDPPQWRLSAIYFKEHFSLSVACAVKSQTTADFDTSSHLWKVWNGEMATLTHSWQKRDNLATVRTPQKHRLCSSGNSTCFLSEVCEIVCLSYWRCSYLIKLKTC